MGFVAEWRWLQFLVSSFFKRVDFMDIIFCVVYWFIGLCCIRIWGKLLGYTVGAFNSGVLSGDGLFVLLCGVSVVVVCVSGCFVLVFHKLGDVLDSLRGC